MSKRLALARAVYPDHNWQEHGGDVFMGCCEGETFDPENNPSQAVDMLVWLLKTGRACVLFDSINVLIVDQAEESFLHDGTASGIRRAVVQAAERCV